MIWTPFGDRCRNCGRRKRRTYNPLKFAVGDRLLDADGNVILDDDGNVMLDDGAGNTCCCPPVVPNCMCGVLTAMVTFSGVTVCNICEVRNGHSWRATGTLDGTYSMPTFSNDGSGQCASQLSISSITYSSYFNDATCSTLTSSDTHFTIVVVFNSHSPTLWGVSVNYQTQSGLQNAIFSGQVASPFMTAPFTVSNVVTCGNSISTGGLGSGGTATVTLVCP